MYRDEFFLGNESFLDLQIPVCEVRSDGRENLIGALIIAGNFDIPEVTVYFNNKLYRGNRTVKVDNSALEAFDSPNMLPIAQMDINIKSEQLNDSVEEMSFKNNFLFNFHQSRVLTFP